ncbi:Protein kinase-like domain [Pseudocohnilembus persalinus]|uniref:Protein kinase-like domain n=1 Tax=Pseudocohnilembus persalinus TaxID=266149 RepID=A0A0V0QPW3_PSEPJ|nr:Protein kinase-like domain [Pseudocohnilembus persalinus]|eukprot:KRX04090.1 Protein kinase-like domain [Pseudocohnilembus persalinus]
MQENQKEKELIQQKEAQNKQQQQLQSQVKKSNQNQKRVLLRPTSTKQNIDIFENVGQNVLFKCMKLNKESTFNSVRHEYQVSQSLQHPNIIKFIQFYPEIQIYGQLYSAVEMIQHKGSIWEEVYERKNRYFLQTIKVWFKEMLETLQYLEQFQVSHNNINSENILIDGNNQNQVYLSNLKFANKQSAQSKQENLLKWKMQSSLKYAGPEVYALLSGQVDSIDEIANDIYSLGMVFFELIFGILPSKNNQENNSKEFQLYKLFRGKETEKDLEEDRVQLVQWMRERKQQEILASQNKNCQIQFLQQIQQANEKGEDQSKIVEPIFEEEIKQMALFFMFCLSNVPRSRPSVSVLLQHPWINQSQNNFSGFQGGLNNSGVGNISSSQQLQIQQQQLQQQQQQQLQQQSLFSKQFSMLPQKEQMNIYQQLQQQQLIQQQLQQQQQQQAAINSRNNSNNK